MVYNVAMKVYVEYAVIDNFVMDYLILRLTVVGVSDKSSIKKRVLSSLIGTVFAVYLPLLSLSVAAEIFLKILTALLMVFFVAEYESVKAYVKRLVLFFVYTVVFGGAVYAFSGLIGVRFDPITNAYGGKFPLFAMLIAGALVFFVTYKILMAIFGRKAVVPFLRNCYIFADGQKIQAYGLIDSGNSILCGEDYVCVASKSLARKLCVCGLPEKYKKVVFSTAVGDSFMRVYTFDKICVINGKKQNIIYKVKIGIPENPTEFGDDYSLILPSVYAFTDDESDDETEPKTGAIPKKKKTRRRRMIW